MAAGESESKAASTGAGGAAKVQEAAAHLHHPSRSNAREAEVVARRYFEAISNRDLDGAVAMWAPGGKEHVRGMPGRARARGRQRFIGELLEAMPDMRFELLSTPRPKASAARCSWRLTGTFAGPGRWNGIAPTGNRVELEGIDLLHVREG